MQKHINKAVQSAEKSEQLPGKPRTRYYFCAAIDDDNNLIHEQIEAETKDQASTLFDDKFGVEPMSVKGGPKGRGYYEAKGTAMSNAQRVSVTVSAAQLVATTGKVWKAQFQGWNVFASGIKGFDQKDRDENVVRTYDDNELVNLIFDARIDKDSRTPKPRLKKQECIPFSKLENVETQ